MSALRGGSCRPAAHASNPEGQGKETIVEGTVEVPEVGAPVLLITCSYWPLPPSETTSRSWNLTPGLTGAWKPCSWRIVGSTL